VIEAGGRALKGVVVRLMSYQHDIFISIAGM
jgi:hypothetical protein